MTEEEGQRGEERIRREGRKDGGTRGREEMMETQEGGRKDKRHKKGGKEKMETQEGE